MSLTTLAFTPCVQLWTLAWPLLFMCSRSCQPRVVIGPLTVCLPSTTMSLLVVRSSRPLLTRLMALPSITTSFVLIRMTNNRAFLRVTTPSWTSGTRECRCLKTLRQLANHEWKITQSISAMQHNLNEGYVDLKASPRPKLAQFGTSESSLWYTQRN